jgi:hypothetical protein
MSWFRKRKREPSEETQQAREETLQARQRLESVIQDDQKIQRLTSQTKRAAVRNNFAADIKRALGGAR